MDVNEELKFLRKFQKTIFRGGVGVGMGGQGGCERRIEVFVKIRGEGVGSGGRAIGSG